ILDQPETLGARAHGRRGQRGGTHRDQRQQQTARQHFQILTWGSSFFTIAQRGNLQHAFARAFGARYQNGIFSAARSVGDCSAAPDSDVPYSSSAFRPPGARARKPTVPLSSERVAAACASIEETFGPRSL